MIPRIRGQVGQAIEGEHKDKWFYYASIWTLDGEKQIGDVFQVGPFDTEKMACEKGRELVKFISDQIEKQETGEVSGKYLDMKNGGVLRPWDNE
jgi:hypothetical protein